MKKKAFFFIFSILFTPLLAQDKGIGTIDNIIKGSSDDINYLTPGYINPLLKALTHGLNQGWYTTAKAHGLGGFGVQINGGLVYFPSSDQTYVVDNSQLSSLKHVQSDGVTLSDEEVPTVIGSETPPLYNFKTSTVKGTSFNGAQGLGLKSNLKVLAIPMASVTVGVGLPGGFELKGRYMPKVKLASSNFSYWGLGVMYDIKKILPADNLIPIDLSLFVGHTRLKSSASLSETDDAQKMHLKTQTTTVQALISKKIALLTLYGGLGYNLGSSDFRVKGTYSLSSSGVAKITDPIKFKTKASGLRTTLGMRLKFAVFTVNADYTIQQYNSLMVGIGVDVGILEKVTDRFSR